MNSVQSMFTNSTLYQEQGESNADFYHRLNIYILEKLHSFKKNVPYNIADVINFVLNTELCQYVDGKTEKFLDYIAEHYYKNFITTKNKVSKIHPITIFVTNNSLLETLAWKTRSREYGAFKKAGNQKINIGVLSSAKSAQWDSIEKFLGEISMMVNTSQKNPKYIFEKLPHIVIMCCHPKRIGSDCKYLLETLPSINRADKGIQFRCNFMFDEADKSSNLTQIIDLIKFIDFNRITIIDDITFLTATPIEQLNKRGFWTKLAQEGICKLSNIDKKLPLLDRTNSNSQYMSLKRHTVQTLEGPSDPVKYLKYIFKRHCHLLNTDKPNIIFAPAKWCVKSHDDMSEKIVRLTKDIGYWTMILNGQFKGFIHPSGEKETLEEYSKKYKPSNENWETRDVLRKWKEFHPSENLLITGLNCVERGVTFNTDGFNFTHMILSHYHAQNLNQLLQILGRGSGNDEYIKELIVICPEEIKRIGIQYVEDFMKLKDQDIEFYTKEDFAGLESLMRNCNDIDNLEDYELHYRMFSNWKDAKDYHHHINPRGKTQRRSKVKNTNESDFYKDSLGASKAKVRSIEECKKRLKQNLARKVNGNRKSDARLNSLCGYENPAVQIGDQYIGGDNSTLKVFIIIHEECPQ